MHRFTGFLLPLVVSAAWPATAGAATVGSVTETYTSDIGGPSQVTLTQFDALYAAPTSGVITAVSARISAGTATVGFVRGATPAGSIVVGKSGTLTGAAGSPVVTGATRFPVQAGDHLAIGLGGGANVRYVSDPSGQASVHSGALPSVGGGLGAVEGGGSAHIAVSATLEPDADVDGYGDETQDSCPALATIHEGPCSVDLRMSSGDTTGTAVGSATVVAATVSTAGPATATATATKVQVGVPRGVQVLALTATGGECTGTTCSIGTLSSSGSRLVYALVRSSTPGTYPISFTASAAEPLINPADDAATATLTVTAPASPIAVVKLCTVPKLRGSTRSVATVRLSAAGCVLGRVAGSKRKAAKVKSQSIRAGVQVIAGTRIGVRLR